MKNAFFRWTLTMSLLWLQSLTVLATGLQPEGTSDPVQIQTVNFDLELRGLYVSGMMEVQFTAARGFNNAASLRFPLPPDSVLYQAEIFLPAQETWMVAETMGRREGQAIYEAIVNQKYDPLLIQRIGTDFYRAKVFPINENGDLRMRVYYAHLLETTDSGYRLRVPFANPDATPSNPTEGVTIALHTDPNYWTSSGWQILDELGTPTTTTSSVDLTNGTAVLSLEDFKMERDLSLELTPLIPLPTAMALYYQPDNVALPGHLHTWWQPDFSSYPSVTSQARNVVLVIDVSGSMSGDKIVQTRKAVIACLEALAEGDYFSLVAFDSDVYTFSETMTNSTSTAVQTAIQWVSALQAGTRTAIAPALSQAAAIGVTAPRSSGTVDLLLITDGIPNVGSTSLEDILADVNSAAQRLESRLRVFSVGIGYDLDQKLLSGLAQKTGGEATFALEDNEITGQILQLFDRVRGGGVSQVVGQIQGMVGAKHTEVNWPSVFPNLTLQMGATGTVTADSLMLTVNGNVGNLPIELSIIPTLFTTTGSLAKIAAPLAAKTWADELEREIDKQGESSEIINEAIRIARIYGIVTRYSSKLALESEDMYAAYGVDRIARDPAGIALAAVAMSTTDETQIGGQGTVEDTPSSRPPPMPMPVVDMVFADSEASGEAMDMSNSTTSSTSAAPSITDKTDGMDDAEYLPVEEEGATNESSSPGSSDCEVPELDQQLRLHIPQLTYAGQYFWADLQLDSMGDGTLVLEVLDYGEITQPLQNFSQCQEVILSAPLRLYLPLLYYRAGHSPQVFTEVILKSLPSTTGELRFKVFDFKS